MMEVCEKTPADRKGGHPAVLKETGRLVLRETAQTPEEDLERFGDIDTWKYFNTNNLWVNLRALAKVLEENDGVLGLPMIVNKKTVDPGDKSTPEVFQLETAMGAAVGVFEGARTLIVPRHALRAGQDDERPARAALRRLRADRRLPRRAVAGPRATACRWSSSTPTTSSSCATSTRASRPARRRWWARASSRSRATCRFGRDVVVRGEASVRNDGDEQLVIDDGTVLEG